MEYFRDPKNRIQADIAHRLGVISCQYSKLGLPADQNFAATLDICILQNLLTNCVELLDTMSKHENRESYFRESLQQNSRWGLSTSMVDSNTFATSDLKIRDFIRHLRNALSHPTLASIDTEFPSTGYTTVPDNSGQVNHYVFVSSPDTYKNQPRKWDKKEEANAYLEKEQRNGTMPSDVVIVSNPNERFVLKRENRPFARIFVAKMTPKQLHTLVCGLSNHLAQPIQEKWDGHTIVKLVA